LLLAAIPVVLLTLVGLALVLSSAAGRLQTTPEPTPVPPTATAPPTAPPPTFAATVTPVLVAAATLTPATPTPVPPSATPVVVVTKEIVVTREIVVVTATPEPTSTPAPTVTPLPTALPAPTEPPAPTAGPGKTFPPPALVSPNEGDSATGQVVFRWTWSGPTLGSNYGFEVRLWKEGQPDHYGAAEPVNDTSVTINLRGAYGVRAGGEGAYWWTVAVVQRQPYTRVGAEAAPRKLNVQIAGGLPSTPTPIP
jgi:hypothetical protein